MSSISQSSENFEQLGVDKGQQVAKKWRYRKVTFLNVPETGVVLKPLPSDVEAEKMVKDECSRSLFNYFELKDTFFVQQSCKELANIMWDVLGKDYILRLPKEQVSVWTSRLIGCSPAFHRPNRHIMEEATTQFDSAFRTCKTRLEKVKKVMDQEGYADQHTLLSSQHWPSTQIILNEYVKYMSMLGVGSEEDAVKYAVEVHFTDMTYTKHPV